MKLLAQMHRLTGFLGAGHGEEAHQDVRQTGSTERQGQAQGQCVERVAAHRFARRHQFFSVRVNAYGFGQQGVRVEAELVEHQDGQQRTASQHQDRLDDLYPGGGRHAAKEHVDHHQRADDHHGDFVLQTEQQHDQLAGTDHLSDQVQRNDRQRGTGSQDAHRGLFEAECRHVGKVEAAQVAQALSHQEHHDRPAEQEADGVDHAVIPGDVYQARDTEERGRGDIVAGNGQTVLETGNATARGVEVGSGLGLRAAHQVMTMVPAMNSRNMTMASVLAP